MNYQMTFGEPVKEETPEELMSFPAWLQHKMNLHNWSASDLAKRINSYPSTVSRLLSGDRNAGVDTARAIARAFNERPEKVMKLAGILPQEDIGQVKELNNDEEELVKIYRELPPSRQGAILDIVRGLFERSRKK